MVLCVVAKCNPPYPLLEVACRMTSYLNNEDEDTLPKRITPPASNYLSIGNKTNTNKRWLERLSQLVVCHKHCVYHIIIICNVWHPPLPCNKSVQGGIWIPICVWWIQKVIFLCLTLCCPLTCFRESIVLFTLNCSCKWYLAVIVLLLHFL